MFYRNQTSHQGVHTNNYVESWHNILKTKYIPGPERRRIDAVIQIFKDEVLPRYQKEHICVEMGFRKQRTNKFQCHAKVLGEGYTRLFLAGIGVEFTRFPTYYRISSFTTPTVLRYITGSACKHMFFLAKDQDLLVVEQVAALIQTEYPQDRTGVEIRPTHPILIESDVEVLQGESDVEVLNPTKSRQSRYQTDNSYTMAPDSNTWLPVAYPPVSLGSLNRTISCSEVKRIVKLDNYSASSALDRAEVIMNTKLNRCAMLQTASIKDIDGFREACEDVLKLVESKCKGIAASKFPPTMPVADVGLLGRVEMDGLLVRW
ncbi:hypothetical protein PtB15_12B480 [Puccinia triticina]|nr:hypothetical protein PtB15_12B480 [Puccinia triticina]